MAKAKFCLIIDTEADFWRYIPSPHFGKKEIWKWRLNKILRRTKFAKGREGLINIVGLLKRYQFPATFTIVGHLYLKECSGYPHYNENIPEGVWLRKLINKRWDYWDPKSDFRHYPGLYLGEFIEREMKVPYFDLGLHAFSHEALTLESKETVESCIRAAVKAANSLKIKPVSFGAPFNMTEDVNELEKVYASLKKNGLKIVRVVGKEDIFKSYHKVSIKPLFKRCGLEAIHVSHYFEGNSSLTLINKILNDIKNSLGKNVVYCLCTHDFTHKNTRNLSAIMQEVLKLQDDNRIKIANMNQLLKE